MSTRNLLIFTGALALSACATMQRSDTAATMPATQASSASTMAIIDFHGFGPAKFGANEEAVRIAWGRDLTDGGATSDSCRQLFAADAYGISFMLEVGKFVRYDVSTDKYSEPGGLKVGDQATKIESVYAGRFSKQPHKYEQNAFYYIVTPNDGSATRLVFEVGANALISRWRIGLPPAVHYVEGCA